MFFAAAVFCPGVNESKLPASPDRYTRSSAAALTLWRERSLALVAFRVTVFALPPSLACRKEWFVAPSTLIRFAGELFFATPERLAAESRLPKQHGVPGAVALSPGRDRYLVPLLAVALMFVTAGLFARAAGGQFVNLDDMAYVTNNAHVQQGLTLQSVRWALTAEVAANWHPLTMLSHELDVTLFGLNPAGHHATSIVLHAANAGLLFWLLARMTGAVVPSALVAALFAWHPLHVESVAWVAERKDVLSTLFWFLALAAYGHYTRRPGLWRYLLVAGLFGLGLTAKPMLVTLPCTLLLLDGWPLGRFEVARPRESRSAAANLKLLAGKRATWRRGGWLVLEKVPLFALSGLFSLITYQVQQSVGAVRPLGQIPWTVRAGNAVVAYVDYIEQAIWPAGLSVYYPHPGEALSGARVLWSGGVLLFVSGLVVWQAVRRPYLVSGWFWYLGTLVPVIGLVQVGDQARADRYTYVPLIGLFIIVAWGGWGLWRRRAAWRPWLAIAALSWLVVLSGLTWRQTGVWHDSETLFSHALAVGPAADRNWVAHYCLGEVLAERGKIDEAERHFDQSAAANPRFGKASFKKGELRMAAGDYQGAAEAFSAATKTMYPKTRVAARHNLGRCLVKLGRLTEAEANFRRAVSLAPSNVQARLGLIDVLLKQGKFSAAAKAAHRGIERLPDQARLLDRLAWIYATAPTAADRNGRQAVVLARRACELTDYQLPQMLDTLGAAYAEAGDFPHAIEWATRAMAGIHSLKRQGQPVEAIQQQMARRIERYQRRRPARDNP